MAPDRIILHLVKKIADPLPLSRIMACTLLSLSYAPDGPQFLLNNQHKKLVISISNKD